MKLWNIKQYFVQGHCEYIYWITQISPKQQGATAEDKKAASPPKKNKGEIEASPAKIIKDKKEKNCDIVHKLYGLLCCAKVMVDEDQEILRKCCEEDLFRSNWSNQWCLIMEVYDQLYEDMCKCWKYIRMQDKLCIICVW